MIKVLVVVTGVASANTYVLYNDKKEAILIDPSANDGEIEKALCQHGLTCKAVLLTHAHVDHCNGVKYFAEKGATVYIHRDDVTLLSAQTSLATMFGEQYNSFAPDVFVSDGDKIDLIGESVFVIHTPGHTPGSVCYLIDKKLYTGDTLFYMSIGRTDFPGGDYTALVNSINKLYSLNENYVVMPGHGPETTIFFERENNPYV